MLPEYEESYEGQSFDTGESRSQLIAEIQYLAQEKYRLQWSEAFASELSYFVENLQMKHANKYLYDVHYLERLAILFQREIRFSLEVLTLLEKRVRNGLPAVELVAFVELTISCQWQLNYQQHQQEDYIELLLILVRAIATSLGMTFTEFCQQSRSFLLHLKLLTQRIITNQQAEEAADDQLYFFVEKKYPRAFRVAQQLRKFITETHNFDVSNDEVAFIAVHIEKLSATTHKYQ